MTPEAAIQQLLDAAEQMDWQGVVLNGGPPCFHLDEHGRFCGRAQSWGGHTENKAYRCDHKFVPLKGLLTTLQEFYV